MNSLQTIRYPVTHPILKNLIKYYWVIESKSPVVINHKLLPVSNIDFILNLSSPIKYFNDEKTEIVPMGFHFNGIRDKYHIISQTGILRVVGISFFSTGLFPILKIPISEFTNKTYDQTHFIKDFKLFTGSTPTEFLNQNSSIKQIIKYC